jgi:hypothetical protein
MRVCHERAASPPRLVLSTQRSHDGIISAVFCNVKRWLFHLMVARDILKSGEPRMLGIRALETGSRRWFGLNPYFY